MPNPNTIFKCQTYLLNRILIIKTSLTLYMTKYILDYLTNLNLTKNRHKKIKAWAFESSGKRPLKIGHFPTAANTM